MRPKLKKIFVGLSGGVDSSVALYLLKKAGYEVEGIFIKVWQPDFFPCTSPQDRLDAMRVCATLQVPFRTLDLAEEYKREVVDYMLAEYARGRTPNPDVMCNKHIKFGSFLEWARDNGANGIATGHYAKNIRNAATGEHELHAGDDPLKDQSYFLWTLGQKELERVLFPVGSLAKTDVRAIARAAGLPTADKRDSQGLCFIGTVDMVDFLRRFIDAKSGKVLDESGRVVGRHDGAALYTLGERRGFRIDKNTSRERPFYVVGKDMERNTIIVSQEKMPAARGVRVLNLESAHFIGNLHSPFDAPVQVRLRYHGPFLEARLQESAEGITVLLDDPVLISPGQSVVFYQGSICLGGGVVS